MTYPDTTIDIPSPRPLAEAEGCSHPPAAPFANGTIPAQKLQPALRRRRRERVRQFVRRLRAGQSRAGQLNKAAQQHKPLTPRRRRKRKAALAFSVAAMGLSSTAAPILSQASPVSISAPLAVDATIERMHAGALEVSDTMKEALAEEEGVRLTVYRDVAGYPTVGVGHLVQPADNLRVGDQISYDRAIAFMDKDLTTAENAVRDLVGDLPLYQHEFDALVDLVFNVGEGNVSERESPLLNRAIADRDYDAIASQLEYHTAGGALARGLMYRSERREAIFAEASYEDPRPANLRLAEVGRA